MSCHIHEEADTKIVYYICQLNKDFRVTIQCTDSDIPVIMLVNFKYLKSKVEMKVELAVARKKTFLNINESYQNIGEKMAVALAICHIFTGNG